MSELPKLPGYTVNIETRTNFAKSHLFDIKNGIPVTDITRVPLDDNQRKQLIAKKAPFVDPRPKEQEITHSLPLSQLPTWVKYDRKVLRYYAYFSEPIYDSPLEKTRVRQCRIYLYLEDHSIHIEEFKVPNSGIPQGKFLERSKIPKAETGFIDVPDLLVGQPIKIWSRTFHIYDADPSTRDFVKSNYHIALGAKTEVPIDDWTARNMARAQHQVEAESDIRTFVEASLGKPMKWHLEKIKKFLANDRKVLKFWCVWDDPTLYGEKRKYIMHYFLADDTIEVAEIHQPNSGRDAFPQLLKRCKLPKVPPPVGAAKIGTDHRDKVDYYTHADLRIGSYVAVYGRHFLIIRADEYTRRFYIEVHGLTEEDFNPIEQKEEIYTVPECPPPPHNGFGTEQDSLGSFYSLVPKPPRKNYAKLLKYDKTALRFLAMLESKHPEDLGRRFIIEYFLSDDTVRVFEQSMRNSGFVAGKFLDRNKVRNGSTGEWFQPNDFYVGALLMINGFKFRALEADEYTLNLMENEGDTFTRANVNDILKGLADKLWDKAFSKTNTFRDIDKDHDRFIDPDEFSELCKEMGWNLDTHQKLTLFRKFDTDNSGRITFPEFFKSLEKFKFDQNACNKPDPEPTEIGRAHV